MEYDDEGFGVWTRRMGVEVPRGARAVIVLDIFKVSEREDCFFFLS